MKTAIVILNWNGKKLLEQFLPSIVQFSSEQADIYVADNASSDDSVSFVKEHFPSVEIIENATNGGYAKGYANRTTIQIHDCAGNDNQKFIIQGL